MKHNKKRNTAFLYEVLIKELTKAVLRSDVKSKNVISSILREHYNINSVLHKELNLYKSLYEVNNVNRSTAEKVLLEVKRVYHSFGKEEIFDEQTEVIKKINSGLSKKIFNNFVSNYKTLATISQMFDNNTPISKKVILEEKMIDLMISKSETHPVMKPIDNITYNIFVQKFNEKYGSSLNENQKILLSKYVILSPENAVEFKIFINEEINRLKKVIKELQMKKEIFNILESFKKQRINDNMIKKILKIQALAAEF